MTAGRRVALAALVIIAGACAGAGLTLALRHGHQTGASGSPALAARPAPAAPSPQPVPPAAPPPPTVLDSQSCKPPPQHPDPVLLVPGTFAATSWALIGPALTQRGYCVFTINYGNAGTGAIAGSARQLGHDIDHILGVTGARQVAIVGHSEGGLMPRYYVKQLGGAAKVSDLIGLAPSNHGTTNPIGLVGAVWGCTACGQQVTWGSTFLKQLNAGNETPPPVDYTVVQTRYDAVVTPYQSAFLAGPRARVTNVTVQARCPNDTADHLTLPDDPVAVQWIENALAVNGPADPSFVPTC
jgi:triacylglycerol lipase